MASTAIPDSEITEYRDSPAELAKKIDQLAEYVRAAAGKFVVYTGAGISTNAGIPDFRGPNGVWTRKAKGLKAPSGKSLGEVRPTMTHMALVSLLRHGYMSYLVSQNCDGLHLRSGIPPECISELHGNCNAEACPDCGAVYWRPERARTAPNVYCLTNRDCQRPGCSGQLRYTTVAFGQSMPDISLQRAELHSRSSLLSLTLGTSMRVQPACELPGLAKKKSRGASGRLCIVNFQKTPYDSLCDVRIFADCDQVMSMLCAKLAIDIPDSYDLQLEPDREKLRSWYAGFKEHWAFRTPDPTHSWCAPKPVTKARQAHSARDRIPVPASQVPNEDSGGYVEPKRDCPHLAGAVSDFPLSLEEAKGFFDGSPLGSCADCAGSAELWLCLNCKKLRCGRYQKGHALVHAAAPPASAAASEASQCDAAISLGDLNTWCYKCESYVADDALTPHYIVLHLAKFGSLPPGYKFKASPDGKVFAV